MPVLRLDRPEESILVCIAESDFDKIVLEKPSESTHFAFSLGGRPGQIVQHLKSLRPPRFGEDIGVDEAVVFRNRELGVLDISAFSKNIKHTLENKKE